MKTIRLKIFALTLVMSGLIFSQNVFAACNTPTGQSTASITSSSATLNWTAVSGSQGYNVRYRIVNAPSWTSTTASTNTKAISSLTPSSNYEWQVQNKCTGNQTSSWTSSATFTTLAAPCNTPTGLSASSITSSSATLNWTAVSGATGYNVRYRIVNAPSWTSTTSTTNTKAISSLTASSNYEFQVQTNCGSSNLSAFSGSATFTTLAPPCNTPTGLSSSGITSSAATLNWTAVSGAVGYNIQYRVVGNPSWTSTTSTSNTKAISSLTASSNYEFQVQTNCGSSNLSAFSGSATFTTLAPPCNTPTGLSSTGITSSAATLNWTAVSGAAGYNIQYRVVGNPTWTSTTSTTNTKAISSLTSSSNYEFQVQTNCGSSNLSAFSTSATFATLALPCNTPSGLSTTGVTESDATLNWTAVSGAVGYNIQYRVVGAPSWTSSTSASSSLIVSSLTASSIYEFQVQTNCGSSNLSAFSSSITFTTLTPAPVPCDIPAGLNTTGITLSDATLNWTSVSGAVGYRIQYRIVGSPSWAVTNSPGTSLVVSGLTAQANYEWQVQAACGGSNTSAFSSSGFFTADPSAITLSVFHGTWTGTNAEGRPVVITLTPNWLSTFTVNGSPDHNNNAIVAYRLPQFSPRYIEQNGPPINNEITISFATTNAILGIPAPSTVASSASLVDNSGNTAKQIYTGLAVVTINGSVAQMQLYLDMTKFSSVAPGSSAPDGSPAIPYATLIRQ